MKPESFSSASMHRSVLQKKEADGAVRCGVCQRRCLIPSEGAGHCRTRVNRDGELHSLIYGRVSSIMVSPIEKKPMFHFYPGSAWLSLGSYGCNFYCPGCQNHETAQVDPRGMSGPIFRPAELIEAARRRGAIGISWTYNEPTLWLEYVLDGCRLAKEAGLFTNVVTNGSITPEGLDLLGPYLDSYRADIKGFTRSAYHKLAGWPEPEGIREVVERAKGTWDMHVEIITNVIPGINDREEEWEGISRWIVENLGAETPWHLTRFFPAHRLPHTGPTAIPVLERARETGLRYGLDFVYLGNVPGHPAENSYCPGCGALLVERHGLTAVVRMKSGGECPTCGRKMPGRFR